MNIEWLKETGPCKNYAAGQIIPCMSEKSDEQAAMYILLSGSIDVIGKDPSGGMTKKVSSVIAGDMFGAREFFLGVDEYIYRTVDNVTVFLLTEASFNDISWAQPDILFEIFRNAYMPPRQPFQSAAPVAAPAAAPAAAPKAAPAAAPKAAPAAAQEDPAQVRAAAQKRVLASAVINTLFLPGHKTYSGKEYPMNERLVYPKEYACPFCKKKFQDFRVFSSKLVESRPMRYDFRKFYSEFNAEWYDIITCHHCYFSMFTGYFNEPKPIRNAAIEDKLAAVRSEMPVNFTAPRDINHVFTMHYLALLCCEGFPTNGTQLSAKIWGNLSWLYEDAEDREMEKAAAAKAAEAYEQVYKAGNLIPVQEQVTCLSIAVMQYRAGIDKDLKKYLLTAKEHGTGEKMYKELAEKIMAELNIADES